MLGPSLLSSSSTCGEWTAQRASASSLNPGGGIPGSRDVSNNYLKMTFESKLCSTCRECQRCTSYVGVFGGNPKLYRRLGNRIFNHAKHRRLRSHLEVNLVVEARLELELVLFISLIKHTSVKLPLHLDFDFRSSIEGAQSQSFLAHSFCQKLLLFTTPHSP